MIFFMQYEYIVCIGLNGFSPILSENVGKKAVLTLCKSGIEELFMKV